MNLCFGMKLREVGKKVPTVFKAALSYSLHKNTFRKNFYCLDKKY